MGEHRLITAAKQAAQMAKTPAHDPAQITIPLEDYKRLLECAEADPDIVWCETCAAWLDINDPARATTEDYTGCWKVATGRDADAAKCKSYRRTW